jgi:hypothetical protein
MAVLEPETLREVIETDLIEARARAEQSGSLDAAAVENRRDAIRAALIAGMKPTHVARLAGLSYQHVWELGKAVRADV